MRTPHRHSLWVRLRAIRRRGGRPLRWAFLGVTASVTLLVGGCLIRGTDNIRPTPAPPKPPARPIVDRSVRVRLTGAQPVGTLQLSVTSPFAIRDAGGERLLYESQQPLQDARVQPASSSLDFGPTRIDADDVVVIPSREPALVVNGRTYRGSLRVRRVADGLTATNVLDIEDYLRGVLRGELPAGFHPQAQHALAVAARTYVIYERLTAPPDRDFDVLADERSQMYIGVKGEDSTAIEAVENTKGEICLVRDGGKDRVFSTYYSSCCGGVTQPVTDFRPSDPDVETLSGNVVCNDCYLAPSFKWGPLRIAKAEITQRVVARYPRLSRLGPITQVVAERVTEHGRITRVKLVGTNGASETLVGEDFRLCVGGHVLRSTRTRIVDDGAFVRFVDGRGFGHGVGLCQYGAERQARLGRDYHDILRFYYPGVVFRTIY